MRFDLMNKPFLILIFNSVLFFASCGLPYANKIKLSESDLEWSPYKINDTIVFTCGISLDTMIITEVHINNPRNTFIFDTEGVNWLEGAHDYKGNVASEYILYHNGEIFEGVLFVLKKEKAEVPAVLEISFAGNYSDGKSIDSVYTKKIEEGQIKCLLFSSSELHKGKYQNFLNLKHVVWSKQHGLFEYEIDYEGKYVYVKKENNGSLFSIQNTRSSGYAIQTH